MSSKIFNVADARKYARRRLPRMIFDYVDGSAGDESACRMNVDCLGALRLLPRVLVNVDKRSYRKRLFDETWELPFGIAPMGMCDLIWPGADAMLARVAVQNGIPLVLSTMASSSIEVTAERAAANAWFQLYVGSSAEVAFDLVDRAAAAGYGNLVFTVDVPEIGSRPREQRSGFQSPIRFGPKQVIDLALHPQWCLRTLYSGIPRLANVNVPGGKVFKRNEARGMVDWAFLDRLREHWQGKLIVKGVLDGRDALRIRDAGADAVWVSNHGGRQLDSAPPAIQVLPQIRAAVGADFPLLFDSGLRNGDAVLKALALGADFVFIGRPFLYALGAEGYDGLQRVIELIRSQVDISLAQLGCADIDDIDERFILGGVEAAE